MEECKWEVLELLTRIFGVARKPRGATILVKNILRIFGGFDLYCDRVFGFSQKGSPREILCVNYSFLYLCCAYCSTRFETKGRTETSPIFSFQTSKTNTVNGNP